MLPRRAILLSLLPLALAACGATREAATTGRATTSAPPPETSVVVYFLRDGRVAPARVRVPHTAAVATASLEALLGSPPAGLATAIPAGGRLLSVSVASGVATASISAAFRGLSRAAQAQVVYTLTQFPTVSAVDLELGDGTVLLRRATRSDYEPETPPILVESPLPGDRVGTPLRLAGTASVYEATVRVELIQDGKTLAETTATATAGAPERGSFSADLPFTGSGAATLALYSPNVGEGPPRLHEVDVPVTLG